MAWSMTKSKIIIIKGEMKMNFNTCEKILNYELSKKIEDAMKDYIIKRPAYFKDADEIIQRLVLRDPHKRAEFYNNLTPKGQKEEVIKIQKIIENQCASRFYQLSNQLKETVQSYIDDVKNIVYMPPKRPDNFESKVANAITFLKTYGEKITDEQAYSVLKDFVEDYDIMCQFNAMLEGQVHTVDAINNLPVFMRFPHTLGNWNGVNAVMEKLNELEKITDELVPRNNGWNKKTITRLAGIPLYFPSDTYGTMDAREKCIQYAKEFEDETRKMME